MVRTHPSSRWLAATALAGLLAAEPGAAQEPAKGPDPVRAQLLRQAKLDAERLEQIRERVHALALQVQQSQGVPAPKERSLVGRVHAIRGSTLYLRSGAAVVPLTVQPSTRVIGRARPLGRPATPAARLRRQLQEGEEVRARFTVTPAAQNLATTLQARPAAEPTREPEPEPAPPPAKPPAR